MMAVTTLYKDPEFTTPFAVVADPIVDTNA
jgi:hypothetical protein